MGYSSLDADELSKRRGDRYEGDIDDFADYVVYKLQDIKNSLKRKNYNAAMVTLDRTIRELDRARR